MSSQLGITDDQPATIDKLNDNINYQREIDQHPSDGIARTSDQQRQSSEHRGASNWQRGKHTVAAIDQQRSSTDYQQQDP
jgi:hypothetical protein